MGPAKVVPPSITPTGPPRPHSLGASDAARLRSRAPGSDHRSRARSRGRGSQAPSLPPQLAPPVQALAAAQASPSQQPYLWRQLSPQLWAPPPQLAPPPLAVLPAPS